jgi:hypothetical protein
VVPAVALTCVVIVVAGVLNIMDNQRTRREIEGLRRGIYTARLAADSCRGSLLLEESAFRDFGSALDSLRGAVRDFESMDPRGVPEAQYRDYMERFNAYNDSVAGWEVRAQTLRDNETACRALVEEHNALSDSLRRRLVDEGTEVPPPQP